MNNLLMKNGKSLCHSFFACSTPTCNVRGIVGDMHAAHLEELADWAVTWNEDIAVPWTKAAKNGTSVIIHILSTSNLCKAANLEI